VVWPTTTLSDIIYRFFYLKKSETWATSTWLYCWATGVFWVSRGCQNYFLGTQNLFNHFCDNVWINFVVNRNNQTWFEKFSSNKTPYVLSSSCCCLMFIHVWVLYKRWIVKFAFDTNRATANQTVKKSQIAVFYIRQLQFNQKI